MDIDADADRDQPEAQNRHDPVAADMLPGPPNGVEHEGWPDIDVAPDAPPPAPLS